MITALSTTLLAQGTNQTSPDPSTVSPGLLGFVVLVAIGLATWFLLRSMTKHLRNVDPRFAQRDDAAGDEAARGEDASDSERPAVRLGNGERAQGPQGQQRPDGPARP